MEIVTVNNISKRYVLKGDGPSNTVRDMITALWRSKAANDTRELWALKDVSFNVNQGETVAILGNNGAGKSTLLKILSQIIKPTSGEAVMRGRVGSLIEVGTGFHQELSGRENIFLSGAVLGMKSAEIQKKFDEIVAFSEIEEFLETPVKFYSSGMFMRLAFSVAAHLEPEILIVDEVLAVGDLSFQRKCLSKMRDINRDGRTILFVSHNMQAILRLCQRAVWLDHGKVRADADSQSIVSAYLSSETKATAALTREWEVESAPGDDAVRLRAVSVESAKPTDSEFFDIRDAFTVKVDYEVLTDGVEVLPSVQFWNEEGICVFTTYDWDKNYLKIPRKRGVYSSEVTIPGNFMAEGRFSVSAACISYNPLVVRFNQRDSVMFSIMDTYGEGGARGEFNGYIGGVVRPIFEWKTDLNG